MTKLFLCMVFLLIMIILSQDPTKNIQLVKEAALKSYPTNTILAMLTASQAILESNLTGHPSGLALYYNNLFGIKGKGTHGSIMLPTHEYVDNHMVTVNAAFAYNNTIDDSFEQHKQVLTLERYKNLESATTFEQAAHMIQKDGYATDPNYPNELISIYNKYLK